MRSVTVVVQKIETTFSQRKWFRNYELLLGFIRHRKFLFVVFRWIPLNGNSSVMMMNGSVLIIQHFTCYWTCFLFLKEFLLAKPCVNLNTCETILPTQFKHTNINTALNNSGHLKVHLNYCCFVYSPSFSFPSYLYIRESWMKILRSSNEGNIIITIYFRK